MREACPYCAAPAVRLAVLGHCGAPLCAATHARKGARRALAERGREARALGAVAAGVARPKGALFGAVPHRAAALVPGDPRRRAAFLAHVARLCRAAFRLAEAEIPDTYAREDAQEPGGPGLAAPACTACRGMCCARGFGTHAFVKEGTIQGFRLAEPGITQGQIMARYIAAMPAESQRGSCLFHGAKGCTLARAHRARLCNSFQCGPLEELNHRAAGHAGPVVIAAVEAGQVRVVCDMDETGGWAERGSPEELPAPDQTSTPPAP